MKTKNIFLSLALALSNTAVVANETIDMTVYRSPTCSCCKRWVSHVEQNGFKVKDIVTDGVKAIKDQNGITPATASCHTALVGGYAIEGHVPGSDIKSLLQNKPKVAGISVPGMPVGTPGMEMGGKKDAYDVISFDKGQKTQVFKSYKSE